MTHPRMVAVSWVLDPTPPDLPVQGSGTGSQRVQSLSLYLNAAGHRPQRARRRFPLRSAKRGFHASPNGRSEASGAPLMHPESMIVWVDSGYAGKLVDWAKRHLNLTIKPVSRPEDASGFVVLPRRWVVETCQSQCTHGVGSVGTESVLFQRRRLYQPGGRVRRSRSSASFCWLAWAMSRCGQWLSRRAVIQA